MATLGHRKDGYLRFTVGEEICGSVTRCVGFCDVSYLISQ